MVELVYALIQIAHNLGAAAVVAIPTAVLVLGRRGIAPPRALVLFGAAAWALPAASGAAFGIASLRFKGELPELAGVALAALVVKISAAALGTAAAATSAIRRDRLSARGASTLALLQIAAATSALAGAAWLRWYL